MFDRDLLELRFPDGFHYPTYRTDGGKDVVTEVREYRLEDLTILMTDFKPDDEAESPGRLAYEAWSLAGRPVPFRFVWHSFEKWGDSYWEDVWQTEPDGNPCVDESGFVLNHTSDDADTLMWRLLSDG